MYLPELYNNSILTAIIIMSVYNICNLLIGINNDIRYLYAVKYCDMTHI